MTDSARTEIIARVRRATAGNGAEVIAAQLSSLGAAPIPDIPQAQFAELFLANVLRNQGTAISVRNKSDATKTVAQYLYQNYRTRKLVAGNDPKLAAMPWRDGGVLPRFGAAIEGDLASVSYARAGIVETGSILTWTGKSNPAANNLLVENHIVLVDLGDLVATMADAWTEIDASQEGSRRHRGINFVSGPSSTADIDFQLIMGAHGPRSWHVVLIGDLPDDTLDNARDIAGLI
ncbi:MAG: L-lactate dehydrogenase complex protein LldG [Halioglobus sp.]